MEKADVLIIGAGIVGLACAERLSRTYGDVLVVDKEPSFGQHSSSRNSEVIHSGVYYPPDYLKTRLCVRGNTLLYDFLSRHGIPHKKCGKIIVAAGDEEIPALEDLLQNGKTNGVPGLELISSDDVRKRMPVVRSSGGLWVPTTGIMDTHGVMKKLASLASDNGALISYSTEVSAVTKQKDAYRISFKDGEMEITSPAVINAAGLWSDVLSAMVGIDPERNGYRLHWNKGEYYKTTRCRNLPHLVYPLPHPKGTYLGIHTVVNLQGELSFGPSSYYVQDLDYGVDDSRRREFCDSINTYMDVDCGDIWPDSSGIRPKLQGPGEEEKDFVIANESGKGFPNFINLIGIESPGLTCALSIAEYVGSLLG